MAEEEPTLRKTSLSQKEARIVSLVERIGPRGARIARELGLSEREVRYFLKKRILLSKNTGLFPRVDYMKLGLRCLCVYVEFPEYVLAVQKYALDIFTFMGDACYLVYFSRTLPSGRYLVHFNVPEELYNRFAVFLTRLETTGLFKILEWYRIDYRPVGPFMPTELFDFKKWRWKSDWMMPVKEPLEDFVPPKRVRYDETDLLILQDMQYRMAEFPHDYKLSHISRRLKMNHGKFMWHWREHIQKRELITMYRLHWIGSTYDRATEIYRKKTHTVAFLQLLVKDVSREELAYLRDRVRSVPHFWAETFGNDYFAEFAFPMDSLVEAYRFLDDTVKNFFGRARVFTVSDSLIYSIIPRLYDQRERKWRLDEEDLIGRFENLVLTLKQVGTIVK
jgi:hypothetical protein